jgi:hypothetical protein
MAQQLRVGHGFDAHRLVGGRKLILGGVEIPHSKGLLGHSDADVILHALVNALLGALGEGDIGSHFPDSDPRYKNVSSVLFLAHAVKLMRKRRYDLIGYNADRSGAKTVTALRRDEKQHRKKCWYRRTTDQHQSCYDGEARLDRPRPRHGGNGGGASVAEMTKGSGVEGRVMSVNGRVTSDPNVPPTLDPRPSFMLKALPYGTIECA